MALGSILGGIGGLFGAIQGSGQQAQQQQQANQQSQAAQEALKQAEGIDTSLVNQFNQYQAPLQGGISSGFQGLLASGGQAGSTINKLIGAASSPRGLDMLSGVNNSVMLQKALQYLLNPQATNTGQVGNTVLSGLQTPGMLGANAQGLSNFYSGEMSGGINPQFASNAQNQLTQQYQSALSDINKNARPGQNISGMQQQAENSLLANSANLAGNLAGQSQQISQQGAQGLEGVSSAVDQQNIQRLLSILQAAGVIDQQTMQYLTEASNMGQGYAQQALGNLGTASNAATSALGDAANYVNAGQSNLEKAGAGLAGAAGGYQSGAAQAQSQADAGAKQAAGGVQSIVNALPFKLG